AGKEDFGLVLPLFADPGRQGPYCRSSERSAALLSPFTFAAHVGTALQVNVVVSESDYLRKAETSLNREQQQDAISSTQPSCLIRYGHERINLRSRQKIY